MSEKIKQLVENHKFLAMEFMSANDDSEDEDSLNDQLIACQSEILSEFARREAVRVKLVEACKELLACTEFRGGIKTEALKAALAANAELEGM